MTEVVVSTEVDTLTEQASAGVVIESDVLIQTVETVDGDDIIVESVTTETITETSTETVYVLEPQTFLVDVAEQGPPGIQGPPGSGSSYPGKTIVYTGDLVTEVLSYLDAAKTQLAERRVLSYTTGRLTTIQFYDGLGALTKTRTLTYTTGVLTSVTDA